jgi:hypothetical protein
MVPAGTSVKANILIVPLNDHESDVFDRNVINQEGIAGLKVPNVSEVYLA